MPMWFTWREPWFSRRTAWSCQQGNIGGSLLRAVADSTAIRAAFRNGRPESPNSIRAPSTWSGSGRDKAHEGRSHEALYPSGHAGDRGPGLYGLGPGGSILGGRAEVEQVADLVVGREEALDLAG